ncbi:MAG: LysR family transcriptional regulator substrate-binding protein, partial [Pseudorhodoplanes sp.]
PLVELNVEIRSSLATCEGVRAGELNAGFMLGSKFQKGLEGLLLGKLEFCIAAPAAWADAVRNANLKDLASLPWIVTAPGTPSYEMREEIFRREGLYVNSAIEVNNVVLVHEFVQAGLGLGLIRRDRAELGVAQGLFVLSRVASVSTNLLFVHPAEQQSDPILHAVLEGVHIVWQDVLGANRPLRVLA